MNSDPQSSNQPDPQTVDLVQRVLNHEASLEDISVLNRSLPADRALLRYFVEMRMLHGALEEEFEHQSGELESISDRVVRFPSSKTARGYGSTTLPQPKTNWRKFSMVAALAILAALGVFWGVSEALFRPAFEVVARYNTGNQDVPERGDWIKTRQTIELESGVVELRSPDGNSFTFQGPGELKVHDTGELTLRSGKLWADLSGGPVKIHSPRGEVTDLGTTFGLDASIRDATRVDVFDGEVRFRNFKSPSQTVDAAKGESLTSKGANWTPQRGEADASRYKIGIRRPLGFTFVADDAEAEHIVSSLPHGILWATAATPSGKVNVPGTPIEITWAGSNLQSAGADQSPEAAVFHTHLSGHSWTGRQAREAEALGLPPMEGGIVIRISNLKDWLELTGAKAYRVVVYRNSKDEEVRFLPISVHRDEISGPMPLATISARATNYLAADYPEGAGGSGARAILRSELSHTQDSLILTTPIQKNEEDPNRGNVSGLVIEPVF